VTGVLLAEVVRSGFVEGRHYGSVAVLDANASLASAAGEVTAPIFPRSSNKPMQAVGMLRAGLKLDSPADLALVAASHSAEPFHVERIRAMLAHADLDPERDLLCPPDFPLSESARIDLIRGGGGRARILMNCSGKHTGMLLTCRSAGWPIDNYTSPEHPLQVECRSAVEDLTGETVAAVGVDGCGAPVFALSLAGLARAFLRLVEALPGSHERAVADAMRAYPEHISGTHEDDARLMRGVPGLLAKGGAEGVVAVAVPGRGAVAIKIEDGGMRARMPVLATALRLLGVEADIPAVPLFGGGVPVGSVRAVQNLFG
jgi:L-asparaginase II